MYIHCNIRFLSFFLLSIPYMTTECPSDIHRPTVRHRHSSSSIRPPMIQPLRVVTEGFFWWWWWRWWCCAVGQPLLPQHTHTAEREKWIVKG